MRRKLPPLNAILAFEAAARHSNFTRAAQELSVAQPAVTRHVARLEDWIGSQLFRRNGSVVQLTREGTVLSELATTLLDRLELGIRDATHVGKDELVVGASFGIAHLWLMPKISALRMALEATVNFLTADDYRAFDDPSVDFSIRFGRGSFGVNCADLLFREHCQIIVAPKFLDQHPEFDPDAPLATLDPRLIFDHGDPRDVGWVTWSVWCELTGQSLPDRGQISKIGSYPTMLRVALCFDCFTLLKTIRVFFKRISYMIKVDPIKSTPSTLRSETVRRKSAELSKSDIVIVNRGLSVETPEIAMAPKVTVPSVEESSLAAPIKPFA
ncbi:LysR family transcriptional regulator [Planktomarina temperata]|nr:LysR family transcriptional regulator [Planktomarina temperata]